MPTRIPTHRCDAMAGFTRHEATPRRSACALGYDRRWQRLARWFRRRHPLCADPFGFHAADGSPKLGHSVDHIVPRSAGGTDDPTNLQTLCASCHARKTALFDGGFGRQRREGADRFSGSDGGEDRTGPNARKFEGFSRGGTARQARTAGD